MNTPADADGALYPEAVPFAAQHLAVGEGHALHVEQCGNPRGFPALFLHGGPGSRIRPRHRRYFDPAFYRVVLFDQRGCGQSTPSGGIADNTTRHLVADIDALRRQLEIERFLLFGGSWGSTLALAYAIAYPERVAAMVLRGIFLGTRAEVAWYLDTLRHFVPPAWDALAEGGTSDLLGAYYRAVSEDHEARALAAAQRWVDCEEALMNLEPGSGPSGPAESAAETLARARIQLHYLVHDCFLAPSELVAGLRTLSPIPALIVQGKLDLVCPPRAAHEVAHALPGAELRLIEQGGHSAAGPRIARALRQATDELRDRLQDVNR